MSNPKKVYFLPPTWDYHPDGPIQLGSIVTSPNDPANPLNLSERLAPSLAYLLPPTYKTNVTWSSVCFQSGRYGLWTEFISSLTGLGIDIGVNHASRREQAYAFDSIETTEFIPSPAYLEQAMAAPGVVAYLQSSRFRKHVYMITAVKVVHGAKAKTQRGRQVGGEAKVGLDGSLTGAPVSLGPEVKHDWESKEEGSFAGGTDFVFAFRLRKIVVHRSGRISHGNYTKAAMYRDTGSSSVGLTVDLPFSLAELELGLHDVSADEFGGDESRLRADIVDEDEECVCVFARDRY